MDDTRGLPQGRVPEPGRARRALRVADEVGLALRDHRRRLGMSQRAYARARGLSRAMLARLEAGAGRMSLDTVVHALDGTGFTLHVTVGDDGPGPAPAGGAGALTARTGHGEPTTPPRPVPAEAWMPTGLVARVRGGGRRFPAHRTVLSVSNPPTWWWMHELFAGPSGEPRWHAPERPVDGATGAAPDGEDAEHGAA